METQKQKAEILIKAFEKAYKEHPDSIGRVTFEYSDDIRDAKPGKLVSQYGDFFFIMPSRISALEASIVDILLHRPFEGVLYQSNYDHQLQIRVSGFNVEKLK